MVGLYHLEQHIQSGVLLKIDEQGLVTEVAEKNPISDIATVGYYYWKQGSDFVKYAEDMIEKDIRVNG